MTTLPDGIAREAVDIAFDTLTEITKNIGDLPHAIPPSYDRLTDFVLTHGGRALSAVWMVWARLISLGLDATGPATTLFPHLDGNPDLSYARNAVTIAREQDRDAMDELVTAVVRDQQRRRTGANIEATSGFLITGAHQYGKLTTTPADHYPTTT